MIKVSFLCLFFILGSACGRGTKYYSFRTTSCEIYDGNDVQLRCWSRKPWTSCTVAKGNKICTVNKDDANAPHCDDEGLKWTGSPSLGDSSACLISILNSTRLDDNGNWTCNLTHPEETKPKTQILSLKYPKFAVTYISSTLPKDDAIKESGIHQNVNVTCRTNYPWKRCQFFHNGVNCTQSIDDKQSKSCSGANMEWIGSSNPYQCQAMIKEYDLTKKWKCLAQGKSSDDQDEKESNAGFLLKSSVLLTCILSYMIHVFV